MSELRLLFSKTDTARYISHLDLMRTFQRAFLRAGIPVRHTEGFNPHAYISIVLPLSVGFSSECEILEFGLEQDIPKQEVVQRLSLALPGGITVRRCYDAERPVKQLIYTDYIVTMEYEGRSPAGAVNAFRCLFSRESLVVAKKSKKAKSGQVLVDIIPLLQRVDFEEREDTITMDAVLRAQNPGLNPEVLVSALREACPELAPDFVTFHRKALLDENLKPFE